MMIIAEGVAGSLSEGATEFVIPLTALETYHNFLEPSKIFATGSDAGAVGQKAEPGLLKSSQAGIS